MEEENIERTETKQEQGKVSLARKVSRMEHLLHRYYTAGAHRHGSVGDPLRGQGRVLALLAVKPETTLKFKVKEKSGKAMSYIVALVDEGLLGLRDGAAS